MKCTSCKTGSLAPAYLEGLFPCNTCTSCEGNLIMLSDYLRWSEQNENTDFTSDVDTSVEIDEKSKAMLCPMTGRIMTKYRISKDTNHRLDLSPTISAIWLDSGEWALLKKNGLAGKLNTIFTRHWQRQITEDAAEDVLRGMYQERFGDNYEAIKLFREKLSNMEERSSVIAYLLADDPYKP